jgi:spore coat polysaccharide biosynthesis protein SpsF
MALHLKKASMEDAEIVLAWRNDEQTRANSFLQEIIDLESHLEWYRRKLADENCYLYLLMDGDDRVGQVRIDVVDRIGEISYMIAPEKRGKGYGKSILALSETVENGNAKSYIGFVKKENEASKQCFLRNGYAEFSAGDMNCYVKMLE